MDLSAILKKANIPATLPLTRDAVPEPIEQPETVRPTNDSATVLQLQNDNLNGQPKAPFVIPPSPETPNLPSLADTLEKVEEYIRKGSSKDITEVSKDDGCAHLCEKCNKWWSHGPLNKCRHPDLLKQGLCPECLSPDNLQLQIDPLAEIEEDDKGKKTLSVAHEIKIRNDEREICKNMSLEQLSLHIEMVYKRELEQRARGMEAHKMRANLIEEQLLEVPPEEREKFRAALLANKPVKVKKEKAKASYEETLKKLAADIKQTATQSGKTLTEEQAKKKAEAMLND